MALPALLRDTLSIPVVGAPLFIVSNPDLVIEQCKAGIVGSFPALNARPKEVLEEWLKRITGELGEYKARHPDKKVAPFAVNQIVHGSNDRLMHDVELCEKYKVPIQITSLRAPDEVVPSAHRYGGLVFHDVTNIKHAKRALQSGVDGLILVCAGAGGHAGALSPFALVPEVRQFYDGCILLSGSIANGASVLAAQAMGADLAYMGTRFIASKEGNATDPNKQCIIDTTGEEIVGTTESDHDDDLINLDEPIRIVPGLDDEGNYGLRLTTFMPFVEDTLFTFKRKDVILYCKPTENLIEYYKDYIAILVLYL